MLPQALPRQLSQLQAPAICFLRAFKAAVCPPPNASAGLAKATLAATGPSHLYRPQPSVFSRLPAPKCFRRPCQGNTRSYRPQPSVFKGVQGCRLPAPKCFRRQLSQLQAPAICFLRAFKAAVCPPPNASAGLAKATLAATGPSHLFLRAFKAAVCPPPNASAGLAKAILAATGPSHLFLKGVQGCRLPAPKCFRKPLPRQLSQLQAPAICF